MMLRMKAVVTGGAGFIGQALVRQLRARGDEVVAVVRDPAQASALTDLGCALVEADLGSVTVDQLADEIAGADALFHLAGSYRVGIPESEHVAMFTANVVATRTVLDAGDPGRREANRLRVDGQCLRRHPRSRGGRELPTNPAAGVPVVLRRNQVPRPPRGRGADRGRRPDPDRHAGHGLRPGRPLPGRRRHPPGHGRNPDRPQRGRSGRIAGPRRRRGRRPAAGPRPGRDRPRLRPGRRDRHPAGGGPAGGRDCRPGATTAHDAVVDDAGHRAAERAHRSGARGAEPNLAETIRSSDGVTYWASSEKAKRELGYAPRDLEAGLRTLL